MREVWNSEKVLNDELRESWLWFLLCHLFIYLTLWVSLFFHINEPDLLYKTPGAFWEPENS